MPKRLLNKRQVSEKTGLSVPTIYRLVSQHEFPRQIPISTNRVAWLESEVDAWIDQKVSMRLAS